MVFIFPSHIIQVLGTYCAHRSLQPLAALAAIMEIVDQGTAASLGIERLYEEREKKININS